MVNTYVDSTESFRPAPQSGCFGSWDPWLFHISCQSCWETNWSNPQLSLKSRAVRGFDSQDKDWSRGEKPSREDNGEEMEWCVYLCWLFSFCQWLFPSWTFSCAELFALSLTGYRRLLSRDDSRQARKVVTTTSSSHQEASCPPKEEVSLQEFSECLNVPLVCTTEVDSGSPVQTETNSDQLAQMVQRSVEKNFPRPPANFKQDLQPHLLDIQEMVIKQLLRMDPLLSRLGLMGHLIGCYHRKIFSHLDTLLQDCRSTQTALVLLNWALQIHFRCLLNIFSIFLAAPPPQQNIYLHKLPLTEENAQPASKCW